MDADGFAIELFSAEFGPDEGKDNAHKENHNWLNRVGGGGSQSDGRSGDESGAVGEAFNDADNHTGGKRETDFAFAFFDDVAIT